MAKPNKPTEFLPEGFGTASGVQKSDFSDTKKLNGFSTSIEDILQGDNLNYMLDTIGKELKYLKTVVDYIRDIDGGKVPFITSSDMTAKTFDELLPSQTGNAGKFLTTNGTTSSWSASLTDIGDPIFTLNFNKTLSSDYIWLDGRELAVSEYPELFAIYGYTYSDTTGSANFKVPNFSNCTIWGGTTAGKVEAGLPNITAEGVLTSTAITKKASQYNQSFYKGALQLSDTAQVKPDVKDDSQGTNGGTVTFDASRSNNIYGNSSTVQPPAIKVKAYTRVR